MKKKEVVFSCISLAMELKEKRERLRLTQKQASAASGIPYGTYVQAETYGRMGEKVQLAVHRWVHKQRGLNAIE